MKTKIKNNLQIITAFLVGFIITSGTIYAATVSFNSEDVEHTKTNNLKTTVKAVLNDLYTIHNGGTATNGDILSGKTAFSGGSLKSGSISKPTTATGNAYTGASGYLNNGSSALTSTTSLTLSNYLSSNQYNFKIGSGEQVTFPYGYYQYPINVSSKKQMSSSNYTLVAGTAGDSSNLPTGVKTYTVSTAGTYMICCAGGGGSNSSSYNYTMWVKLNGTEIAGSDANGKPGYTGEWLWFKRIGRTGIASRDYMAAKMGVIIRNFSANDVITFNATYAWIYKIS